MCVLFSCLYQFDKIFFFNYNFFMKFKQRIREKIKNTSILDKYILKQVIEVFIMGVCIFTTIVFASDTFITLIKQISLFGIPFHVALLMIVLNLPSVIVLTIPMGVLLSTVMTLNKLSLDSEITVLRACGVGISRIAKPIFIFAAIMCICSFIINETVVPIATKYSKDLALWSLSQKNVPNGKENFVFKELDSSGMMRRLFYVGNCEDKVLYNITVLDTSKKDTIQVLQANTGKTTPSGWDFHKGAVYTIDERGKVLNTTLFEDSNVKFGLDLTKQLNKNLAKEMNFTGLLKFIAKGMKHLGQEERNAIVISLYDKLALPVTTIVLVLVGVPLAITPPRVRYNRGFLFSILIIFTYYLIRALSISFGEAGAIHPLLAAWLANMILAVFGFIMYYKKAYTIS